MPLLYKELQMAKVAGDWWAKFQAPKRHSQKAYILLPYLKP